MNWELTLKLKGELERAIKARSMIYQVHAKEEAARAFDKPLDAYYHLPYTEWAKISRKFVRKQNRVMAECRRLGIPGDMPYSDFPHYRKKMGLNEKA
jgi:hypothetical protein